MLLGSAHWLAGVLSCDRDGSRNGWQQIAKLAVQQQQQRSVAESMALLGPAVRAACCDYESNWLYEQGQLLPLPFRMVLH